MQKMGQRQRRRKRSRGMGPVRVLDRADYAEADVDTKVALIQELIPVALLYVEETLHAEVEQLAGARHARKGDGAVGSRYGTNPGSVRLGGHIALPFIHSPL